MHLIDVQTVTKIFRTRLKKGNVVALDAVSLTVGPGEIFGLLGPNGAGKTTLVKLIMGMLRPNTGVITINGLEPEDPRSRQRVGFLGENYRFPTHLTGGGLLRLTCRLFGVPTSKINDTTDHLLGIVGMEKWSQTRIAKYSKGMTQRIGLAQSLVGEPELIILDEPTDGVDPVGRVEIREVLKRIRDGGTTVFLNSHLLGEVEAVADRVAILKNGRLVRVSSIDELTHQQDQYRIEAVIGDNQVNIPAEMGKRVSISSDALVVEVDTTAQLNDIIDLLRFNKIEIQAILPQRISLEQSFMQMLQASGDEVGS